MLKENARSSVFLISYTKFTWDFGYKQDYHSDIYTSSDLTDLYQTYTVFCQYNILDFWDLLLGRKTKQKKEEEKKEKEKSGMQGRISSVEQVSTET